MIAHDTILAYLTHDPLLLLFALVVVVVCVEVLGLAYLRGFFDDLDAQALEPFDDADLQLFRPWESAQQRRQRARVFGEVVHPGPGEWRDGP